MLLGKDFILHMVSFYGVSDTSKSFHSEAQLKTRQGVLNKTARKYGDVDELHSWNLERLQATKFYEKNKDLLDRSKGCGYWAWKPYIILETMKAAKHGDFIFYCDIGRPVDGIGFDHGNQITESLLPIVEWAKKHNGMMPGVYLPHHGHSSIWIKSDCYKILECDEDQYKKTPTVQAGYTMWRKSEEVIKFLQEWLTRSLDPRLITDDPNVLGDDNAPGFIRHCHDQAILTLLCKKNNLTVFGDPKYQFWGFRNINFIAKQAAYENRKRKSKLYFEQFNQDYNAVPKFLTNWIELLFCERREDVSRMLVMGDDDWQIDMWTRYFPKASVFSEKNLNPTDRISGGLTKQSQVYDFLITNAMLQEFYTVDIFLRIYESLKDGGAALIGPLPNEEDCQELDNYARSVANSDGFPAISSDQKLPTHSPKIHNSKNPVFLQSGLNRFILLYKPKRLFKA